MDFREGANDIFVLGDAFRLEGVTADDAGTRLRIRCCFNGKFDNHGDGDFVQYRA